MTAAVGENLTIRLEVNASTGYQWQLEEPIPASVTLISSDVEASDARRVGAAGTQVIVLAARTRGSGTLVFALRRSWETGVPAAQTVQFKITVR